MHGMLSRERERGRERGSYLCNFYHLVIGVRSQLETRAGFWFFFLIDGIEAGRGAGRGAGGGGAAVTAATVVIAAGGGGAAAAAGGVAAGAAVIAVIVVIAVIAVAAAAAQQQ